MDSWRLSEPWHSSPIHAPSTLYTATRRLMEPCHAAQQHTSWSDTAEPRHPSHANAWLPTLSYTEPCKPSRRRSSARAEPHHSSPSRTSRHAPRSRSSSRGRCLSHSSSRSKDGCHHSPSHDSRPHCARSRSRLRSCSPTADYDDYPSYPKKVAQVRLLFADSPAMLAHPPNPTPARDVNLASCQSTTPPRPGDLPWNPSTAQIWDYYMDQLTGRDPKAKSSTGPQPCLVPMSP